MGFLILAVLELEMNIGFPNILVPSGFKMSYLSLSKVTFNLNVVINFFTYICLETFLDFSVIMAFLDSARQLHNKFVKLEIFPSYL